MLVNEPQTRGTIQCPYHAWTYALDGSLRGAPRSKEEPDFDMSCLGLVPVQVGTWGPFVFVNPDMDAPPLDAALGNLPEVVAENGLDVDSLRFHNRGFYEIRANWKIAIENYLECYHCQLNHPGFVKLIDEQRQRMEVDGLRLSQFPPIHPDAFTDAAPYDVSDSVPTAQYHILFPAMKFNVNPGRPNLSIGPLWPVAADRTAAWFDYFFAGGHRRGLDRADARVRQPGRRRGHRARGGGAARRRERRAGARTPAHAHRAADRRLPGHGPRARGARAGGSPLAELARRLEVPLAPAHALAVLERLQLRTDQEALRVAGHDRADLGAGQPAVAAQLRGGLAANLG